VQDTIHPAKRIRVPKLAAAPALLRARHLAALALLHPLHLDSCPSDSCPA